MMGNLSKSELKFIKSLQQKKYRDQHLLFPVEGVKMVGEAIKENASIKYCLFSCTTNELPYSLPDASYAVSEKELQQVSSQKNPNKIVAVCSYKNERSPLDYTKPVLALDSISDPGNLGTIIRLADWFGVEQVVCSQNSVDQYNPKVVQASMGSVFRVGLNYAELSEIITESPESTMVFYADMQGENLHQINLPVNPIIILGSESHGVSSKIKELSHHALSIPRSDQAESLNVAMATGIICSELRRQWPL
jgi:TrmH family RNA methyltransferase